MSPALHGYTADSPSALLHSRVAAALADGRFRPACPHPSTADRLYLPSGTLMCAACRPGADPLPDSRPGECSSSGAPGGCLWTTWLDEGAHVLVTARICPPCMRAGNISLAAD